MASRHISVYGYLVIRDDAVAIIQSDFDRENWLDSPYVEIGIKGLKYALLDQLTTRAGGVSPIFDQAVVDGGIDLKLASTPILIPEKISVRTYYKKPFQEIDFSAVAISSGRKRYEAQREAAKL